MILVSGAVLLIFIAMSVRDGRARRNRAHDSESLPGEPPLSPPPSSGPRPRSWLFNFSFLFLAAVGLVALPILLKGLGVWHLPAFGESFFFQAEDGIRDYKVTGVQTCALPI